MRILFLDLDTLRPDHLGCYGYHRNTSPNIDAIARQGTRFEQYHCSDAPCLPSRAALMSGRFGFHTGVVGHGGTAADMRLTGPARGFRDPLEYDCLPSIARRAHMRTTSISPFAERHSAWWFNAGFFEVFNTGWGGMESAEQVTPTALEWINRHAREEDWFLHINYWDPHAPYRSPEAFGNPFADEPLPDWFTEETLDRHRQMVGPHCARESSPNMFDNWTDPTHPRNPGELHNLADVRLMIDGYDCGINYMDAHIGQLFQAFAEQGVMDDLTIIISADHGENFGELGIYAEHATADQATTRIPMIIRWPGCAANQVDTGLHYNLDLAPTLAELLTIPASARWDGESYARALHGDPCGRDSLVVSQCAHVCQRSVRFGNWLYVRTYHDGYHLFPQEMLYNIVEDPHEQHDVAKVHPAVCHEGAARLLTWGDTMLATMPEGYTVDPLWTVMAEGGPEHMRGELPRYCAYLEQSDRGWAVPELKRRHPKEFA